MKEYNINIPKLCEICAIGKLVSEPVQMEGGFLHRMYDVRTEIGRYAVKALNPNIMARDSAVSNYIFSEKVSERMSHKIPVSCAVSFKGTQLQNTDDQYYLIYDYIDGQSIGTDDISPEHSYKIGEVLAHIHNTDFFDLTASVEGTDEASYYTDWNFYLSEGKRLSAVWYDLLKKHIDKLYELNKKMNIAAAELDRCMVISHCDLDYKNVLWHDSKPILIDWECAGQINLYRDFLDTALYWSADENMNFKEKNFKAFADGYKNIRNIAFFNAQAVLYCGLEGRFGWLEYNLKRSLGIECSDETEKKLGTEQVNYTIEQIDRYMNIFNAVTDCFDEIIPE